MRKIIKAFEGVYVEKIVSDESEVYKLKNQFGDRRFKVTPMEMGKYKVEYYDNTSDRVNSKDIKDIVSSENKKYSVNDIYEFIEEVEDCGNMVVFFIVGEDYYGRKYLPLGFNKGGKYDRYGFSMSGLVFSFRTQTVEDIARDIIKKNTSDKKYCIMSCRLKDFDKFIQRVEASRGDISSCSFLEFEKVVNL